MLPFENLGSDPSKEYLADGITDDMIMALARFPWLHVASRGASFARRHSAKDPKVAAVELGVDFLVDGVIRHAADRIRISAHLTDAIDGRTVWSEHYDLHEADVFAVQDAIAERIAGAVEPELLLRNGLQVTPHTSNVTVWDLARQGTFNFHKVTPATHLLARKLFREAAEVDPMLSEAQLWRARVNAGLIAYGWSEEPDASAREGLDAALKATISMHAIRTRTMHSRSYRPTQAGLSKRSSQGKGRSNSVRVLRWGIWLWEWHISSGAMRPARSGRSLMASTSIHMTRRMRFGSTF